MVIGLIDRRTLCCALVAGALAGGTSSALSGETLTVTDVGGRAITVPERPKRIILLEARDIVTMALFHPDPASLVVGWAAADRIDSLAVREDFVGDRRIATVGRQTPDTISLEGLISLSPDLVVASSYMAPQGSNDLIVERLTSLGIPVVFSDISSNATTGNATGKGAVFDFKEHIRMWGDLLGARDKAAAFTRLYDDHLARIATRLIGVSPVTTYLEVASSMDDCCWAAGNKIWGELLKLAGGGTLPGVTASWFQKLQLEYLLTTPHEVYIASGGEWSSGGRPSIGPGIDLAKGRDGLRRMIARPGFMELDSVKRRRVHGIWTGLITLPPFNILFIEVVAKWLHPDRCGDIDPAMTLAEINDRFLARPINGPFWVSLEEL